MWLLRRGHIIKNCTVDSPWPNPPWKLAKRPDPPDFSCREEQSEFPQDPASESDSEVIINVPLQSPETSDTEATFHTPPKEHPLWTEGSVWSATQLLKGRRPTFVTHLLERTCSLSNIFHPDYLIRERHLVLQEKRLSLQSDSLDCSFYVVDLHYRSLVKHRQESQIPPPLWRGPSRREHSPIHPNKTPLHIQLPQKATDSYKLVYISYQARGDSNSGEHSPADSQGVDFHPGTAPRNAHSLEPFSQKPQ